MAKKEKTVVPEIVDSVEALEAKMKAMREAQKVFATFTQEQVDKIFYEAAMAANKQRIPLAKMAVEETQRGIVEDKVIKNHYAAEYIYNAYKNTKTCGVIEEDTAYGIKKVAEPIGLVAAVIPTTNPTSTAIFKTLICLKTRNAIIISPHPAAKECTIAAAKVVLEAAVKAGAPEGIIGWIDAPSLELTNTVMRDAIIFLYISSLISRIRFSRRITPPSRVLNGFPSFPFIVPNPRNSNLVFGLTIPVFFAQRNTCVK